MDALTKFEENRRQHAEVMQRVRQHALAQGLVIVKISPRVYQVVTVAGSTPLSRSLLESVGVQKGDGRFFTYLEGEVVCRGSWVQCRVFVDKTAVPLPPELGL